MQTCLFLDKPSANTQHSRAEATHRSHQAVMVTNVFSHMGEKRLKDEVGESQEQGGEESTS